MNIAVIEGHSMSEHIKIMPYHSMTDNKNHYCRKEDCFNQHYCFFAYYTTDKQMIYSNIQDAKRHAYDNCCREALVSAPTEVNIICYIIKNIYKCQI